MKLKLSITDDLEDVQAYIGKSSSPVIVDIETTSLTVGKGRILCVAFAPYDRDDVMVWWPKSLKELKELHLPRMVAHNSPFEQKWLSSYGCKSKVYWDTMFMAYLLDENHPIGLKDLGQRLLGYKDWSDDNVAGYADEFGRFEEDQVKIPRERYEISKLRVSKYNGMDVHITRELMKWQRRRIKNNLQPGENPVRVMREIMIPAILPLRQMEHARLPVRTEMVQKAKERVAGRIAEIEHMLDQTIPPVEERPDWLKKQKVNWGATNWTKWWLYVYNGALCPARGKPTKTWPDGNPSLAQEVLAKIDHPAARLLSERATLYKNLTGFLIPILERTREGRISTQYNLTGTVTGRLSSNSPTKVKTKADVTDPWANPGLNSQQIPRDKATRTLFGEKGLAWIEADFSQLELRVAARMANERTMLELFAADEDIHTYIASKLVRGGEVTKESRTLAKGVNFGFLYGMHSKHFANYVQENYGVTITQKEAEAFRQEYFDTFSDLPDWYRRQRSFALEYGGVPNAFGRFRHLPRVYNDDYWVQENAFRQAINAPVQSTGSDFMLISLSRLARDLRLRQLGAKLVATVHDSVCLTAPYSNARKAARIIKTTMESADDGLQQRFFLKADVTISRSWGGEPLAEY